MCYIIIFYIFLITYSLKSQQNNIFIFRKFIYFIKICITFHILIINISNINSIANKYFDPKNDSNNFFTKNWSKFGFYYVYYEDDKSVILLEDWIGYLFGCLSFLILSFINKNIILSKNENIIEEEEDMENPNSKEILIEKRNILSKLYKSFINFFSSADFILHIIRIIAIIWLFIFPNFIYNRRWKEI